MIKPEGYPDLVKVKLRGDEFLIDYADMAVRPLGITELCPKQVVEYLFEEGFISYEEEPKKGGNPSLN